MGRFLIAFPLAIIDMLLSAITCHANDIEAFALTPHNINTYSHNSLWASAADIVSHIIITAAVSGYTGSADFLCGSEAVSIMTQHFTSHCGCIEIIITALLWLAAVDLMTSESKVAD